MIFCSPGPRIPTTAKPTKEDGKVHTISTMRMMIPSTIPPLYPAITPSGTPMIRIPASTAIAFPSVVLVPAIKRERMHRPSWSLPNGYVRLGAAIRSSGCNSFGSFGIKNVEKTATRTTASRIIPPMTAGMFFKNRCRTFCALLVCLFADLI